ncbi:MAG: M14 family metallocarboxypeptidase [Oscillospiraceae bacterium]|nr:M14 family metallocarboxypeptidase [Oscillospiraceae bacterium]
MDEFYQKPPRYESVCRKMIDINKSNKNVRMFSIGNSLLGRKIYALGIGNLKNAILYSGAIHAQEWLTCLVLLRFFEDLSLKNELFGVKLDDVFSHRGLIIVPLSNPDGVEIAIGGAQTAKQLAVPVQNIIDKSSRSWQANARGVDLNHNFDAGFQILKQMEREAGITCPAPRQYGGICPNSEPETRALVWVCNSLNIQKVIAFHSQGEEIYYYYGDSTPKESQLMADALAASSGYTVCEPTGLASHGGFKDWFIKSKCRPGFTVEIGKGENPLPIDMLMPIYNQIKEMLVVGVLL